MLDDERALTNNLLIFVGTLAIGAVLYFVVGDLAVDMLDWQVSATPDASEGVRQGQNYQYWVWDSMAVLIVLFGFIQLIAAAAFEGGIRQ
ncbi:hypothetical protein GCM10010451_68520 [Streptomyces virens]|uniref:Uncharacterized protein n=1 Tax=Streptomyces virens TaxID=285572 RepID=A0ABN3V1N1_9ACTN